MRMNDDAVTGMGVHFGGDPPEADLQGEPIPSADVTNIEDDGRQLLYPNIGTHLPLKTSDRLLDDILCSVGFLTSGDNKSILNSNTLEYSKQRPHIKGSAVGFFQDQVIIQTKYEYPSKSCPEHNKIFVIMGILIGTDYLEKAEKKQISEVTEIPIYHVKISVKVRSILENSKKLVGVSRYYKLDQLHDYDRVDFPSYDPTDSKLLDSALYATDDTNKIVLIEIYKPEFDPEDKDLSVSSVQIKNRFAQAKEKFPQLAKEESPTQLDSINTLFKLFKGPLKRKSDDAPQKSIEAEHPLLISNMNPSALVTHFGFTYTNENIPGGEYMAPDLVNYLGDPNIQKLRDTFTRKCLELIAYGNIIISSLPQNITSTAEFSKKYRILRTIQPEFSLFSWLQLLGDFKSRNIELLNVNEHKGYHLQEAQKRVYYSPFDIDSNFTNLSVCLHYAERDIIQNYERLITLDEPNIGIYFDSLSVVANRKGSYQLLSYCGKQDVIGQEALQNSLAVFGIDYTKVTLESLDENLLLSVYKHEWKENPDNNRISDLKNALRLLAKYFKSDYLKFYVDYEPYRIIQKAYDLLEIDESVDEDIIQTVYTIKINDAPGLKIDCDRALYTIAYSRRSLMLFNFLFDQCPEFQRYYGAQSLGYHQSFEILQINENITEPNLLHVFQQKWKNTLLEEPDQLLKYRAALTKIALERNSNLLLNFLETGNINPNSLPAENWPTGINNIGNTCYLNSLLQFYFAISPLREYIVQYQKTIADLSSNPDSIISKRRIGGRQVGKNEIERSVQFLYQLRDLYNDMIFSSQRCVTPKRELAYLAFAPSSIDVEFENAKTKSPISNTEGSNSTTDSQPMPSTGENIDHNMDIEQEERNNEEINSTNNIESNDLVSNNHDIEMLDTDKENEGNMEIEDTAIKVAKIDPEQLENALELGRQQDVTECIGNVLFQLESSSSPTSLSEDHEQNDLIKELFFGETNQHIKPLKADSVTRTKVERFVSLLVNIADHPKDVYDALDLYFKEEYLTMEEYGEVKRELAIKKFPTILQIQIQRVYYDRERFMPYKSIEPLPFESDIYLDRYADTDDVKLLQKREETAELKRQLRSFKERQKELLSRNELGLSRRDAFKETANFLRSEVLQNTNISISEPDLLATKLEESASKVADELSDLYVKITNLEEKINHQFDDFTEHGYTLFAVFIHRGEASYGHYWVYIKDFVNSIWRKYNDETVTEVPEEEVMNFTEGNTATPYFIVFVKKGHEKDIEPLKRMIEKN